MAVEHQTRSGVFGRALLLALLGLEAATVADTATGSTLLKALRNIGQISEVAPDSEYDQSYGGYWYHKGPANKCVKGTAHEELAEENVVHRELPVPSDNCAGLPSGPGQKCFYVEEGVVEGSVQDFCDAQEGWAPDFPPAGTLFENPNQDPILPAP